MSATPADVRQSVRGYLLVFVALMAAAARLAVRGWPVSWRNLALQVWQ